MKGIEVVKVKLNLGKLVSIGIRILHMRHMDLI